MDGVVVVVVVRSLVGWAGWSVDPGGAGRVVVVVGGFLLGAKALELVEQAAQEPSTAASASATPRRDRVTRPLAGRPRCPLPSPRLPPYSDRSPCGRRTSRSPGARRVMCLVASLPPSGTQVSAERRRRPTKSLVNTWFSHRPSPRPRARACCTYRRPAGQATNRMRWVPTSRVTFRRRMGNLARGERCPL